MAKNSKPCFYLFLQKRLLEATEKRLEKKLTRKDAEIILSYTKIPKTLQPVIMKELQKLELIKVTNKNSHVSVEVINSKECDRLSKLGKLYHSVGIF